MLLYTCMARSRPDIPYGLPSGPSAGQFITVQFPCRVHFTMKGEMVKCVPDCLPSVSESGYPFRRGSAAENSPESVT